jgi:hypothetical protein
MLLARRAKWTIGVQHISHLQHLQHLQLQSDVAYLAGEDSPSIHCAVPDMQALFK